MARARAVLREKVIDERGNIMELAIWEIPATEHNPQRIRYRLAFIPSADREPAVLYDNHHPKGHHRHIEGVEEPYNFTNIEQLISDFVAHVRRILGDETWPKR